MSDKAMGLMWQEILAAPKTFSLLMKRQLRPTCARRFLTRQARRPGSQPEALRKGGVGLLDTFLLLHPWEIMI